MNYFWATLKHKWYVLLAGLKVGGIPFWRLIIHDWTKFTRSEYPHYQRQFFGDKSDPVGFATAWNHHESHNPHHWGYWIPRSGKYAGMPLPMPETYVREMVADWMGASRAYTGSWNMAEWLSDNGPNMAKKMHDETITMVHCILMENNYVFTDNCDWICLYVKGENWQ